MNIHTYGTDERLIFCREYLLKRNIRSVDNIILLPIPTAEDGEYVKADGDFAGSLAVVGYGIPKRIRRELGEMGGCVIDLSLDERFLSENAELTAIGAIGKILTATNASPRELSVGIIGYGRIGGALLRILSFLGAKITVFTSKAEVVRELCMVGISSAPSAELSSLLAEKRLSEMDILINTAPAGLLCKEALGENPSLKIIELASGDNFPKGVVYERLNSLPARMYPKSAGRIMGDSILRILGE